MFVKEGDYLKLLQNLRETMEQPLVFVREEWEPGVKIKYPVYKMGDVELWMNHYPDYDLAKRKFEERRKRINWDNLLIMIYTANPKSAEAFENLPYNRKICLTNFKTDLPSALYLEISKHPFFHGKGDWVFSTGIARGNYSFYDPWEIMLGETHVKRWVENVHGLEGR